MPLYKIAPTNECTIEVTPRNLGNFGSIRISGLERTVTDEYRLCQEIASNIKRHVDDIGHVSIKQKVVCELNDGTTYETLFDLLQDLFDDDGGTPNYQYRYQHKSEEHGTRGGGSFEKLIETAWSNPWNFEVTYARPSMTKEQSSFLKRVIEQSLAEKGA